MREEVTAAGPQQVHLLAHVVLQFVEAGLGGPHLGLDLGGERPERGGEAGLGGPAWAWTRAGRDQREEVKTRAELCVERV